MEKESEYIKWFSELSNKDVSIAGGKGASLSEMYNIPDIPIPPGFVVTAQAYSYFIEKTNLWEKINQILSKLDIDNTEKLQDASKTIRNLIEEQEIPQDMKDEIIEAYEILGSDKTGNSGELLEKYEENSYVAVRSSATTEDLADASFAGQQDSFLNVKGKEDLMDKVRKCISSLFTARAIYYRKKKGFEHDKALLAVVVQKMINSEKSGVIFSDNPTTKEDDVVIEAVWGLGEGIVSGQIKPDHYVISKNVDNFEIVKKEVFKKKIAIIRGKKGGDETIKLDKEKSEKQVLNNYEIKRLAQYAKKLEEHYKKPQDIEFAIENEKIYIVQSRPITTKFEQKGERVEGNVLLSGLAASPGISSGVVKVVKTMDDLKKVEKGDILVTEMTNPDMVMTMQKASGIITDEGGITSHASIVSREMGIPAVVGTGNATEKLKDGDIVTVDGYSGRVIEGKGESKIVEIKPVIPTKTGIKVIVDLPEYAERAALSKAKAIGLTRLEGIIAMGGKHPIAFVKNNKTEEYVKLIAQGIKKIVEPFDKIWIRTSDIRSDEYRNLEGAPKEIEGNPMLGDHGIRFSLKNKDIMRAELLAIKEVADELPDKEFGVMMPQIISVSEVKKTKQIAEEIGLPGNIKIGIMVETPAAVQIIDKLCEEGIDFVSFGTNDLTQYTLAIDRNNEEVQEIYDETHLRVLRSISHVIRTCKKYGVETSICGQAGSREEMVRFLINEGITSISVNADAAFKVSELVAELEKNIENIGYSNKRDEKTKENEDIEKQESEVPVEIPIMRNEVISDDDIEDVVLRELENNGDYGASAISEDGDIPVLNDAIPIDSDSLSENSEEEEEEDSEEDEDPEDDDGDFIVNKNSLMEDIFENEEKLEDEWDGEVRV